MTWWRRKKEAEEAREGAEEAYEEANARWPEVRAVRDDFVAQLETIMGGRR